MLYFQFSFNRPTQATLGEPLFRMHFLGKRGEPYGMNYR